MIDAELIAPSKTDLRSKLLNQYKDSANIGKMVDIVASRGDDVESMLMSIREAFVLDTAVGEQLEMKGALFNVDREGRSVEEYRLAIKLSNALRGYGTPEEIIEIFLSIFNAPQAIYYPEYPASYWILSGLEELIDQSIIDRISPSGVRGRQGCFLSTALGVAIGDANDNEFIVHGACSEVGVFGTEDGEALLTETGDYIVLEGG